MQEIVQYITKQNVKSAFLGFTSKTKYVLPAIVKFMEKKMSVLNVQMDLSYRTILLVLEEIVKLIVFQDAFNAIWDIT